MKAAGSQQRHGGGARRDRGRQALALSTPARNAPAGEQRLARVNRLAHFAM